MVGMLAIFPEISTAAQTGDTERLSILARRYFGAGAATAPSIDVAGLIQNSGIPITRMCIKEFGAIAVRDERGHVQCSIVTREGLTAEEERFLLGHLLGHFLLHVQPRIARTEWTSSGFREQLLPSARYCHAPELDAPIASMTSQQRLLENAADEFAAALLMPSAMLLKAVDSLRVTTKIARVFGVTSGMIERRLDDLHVKSQQSNHNNSVESAGPETHPIKIEIRPSAKGRKIADETTAHMVRELHHQAAPTPRAVAALSYNSNQTSLSEPVKSIEVAPAPGKGMERLREIARMLDKSGR